MRERIDVEKSDCFMPYSPVIKVASGELFFISGATALPLYHDHPHITNRLSPPVSAAEQARLTMNNIKKCLDAAQLNFCDIVRIDCFLTNMKEQDEIGKVMDEFFKGDYPAGTMVEVRKLVDERLKLEVNAVAVKSVAIIPTFINPPELHKVRSYSHVAVVPANARTIYIAGQGGKDIHGHMPNTFEDQLNIAFANLQTALHAADSSLAQVVKITSLVVDHDDQKLQLLSSRILETWNDHLPTHTLIPVPKLAREGMLFEIEAVAIAN